MAGENNIPQTSGNELNAVGRVLIVNNQVQAQSTDGTVRVLEANGPIFFNDRIITGPNGSVSIGFGEPVQVQLDLGRESDIVIDEDVYTVDGGEGPVLADVTAEIEQIQQAILEGEDVQIEDLPAPAAGPAAGPANAGGGTVYTEFTLTGEEVTPDSGAETTGVGLDFLDPETAQIEPEVAAPVFFAAAAPAAVEAEEPVDTVPVAGDVTRVIDEAHFLDGTDPDPSALTTTGTLADLGVDFGDDLPGRLDFGSGKVIVIDNSGDSISVPGLYGTLTVNDNGNWSYTLDDNISHPNANATGTDDQLPETFSFLALDEDGDSAPGSITINILDDGPVVTEDVIARVVEEEALDNYSGFPPVVGSQGNPDEDDGPEDPITPDSFIVQGSLASLVNVGADNPGTFTVTSIDNLPQLFSQGGTITYRLNANGTTIEAWVEGGGDEEVRPQFAAFQSEIFVEDGGGDRLVFTLDVQPNGDYTFRLYDQLDHVGPEEGVEADENIELLSDGDPISAIDFSGSITVTDTDNDSTGLAPGSLSFTIVDDIPRPAEEFRAIDITVLEDGLSTTAGDAGDASEGYREGGEDTYDDQDSSFFGESVAGLFDIGADETGMSYGQQEQLTPVATYGITTDQDILDQLDVLYSNGEQLYYLSDGHTLRANTAEDGSGRDVFTLTVYEDGHWTFDLDDQLDHIDDPDNGENWELEGSSREDGALDLSTILTATDYDGDQVTGSATGSFVLRVQDDAPAIEATGVSYFVSEYAGNDNLIGTYELDEYGNPINAQIIIASSNDAVGGSMGENEQTLGSYEAGTKFFIISDGGNNPKLSGSTSLKFVENTSGSGPAWVLAIDGTDTDIGSPAYFMDVDLNADGLEHFKDENGNIINEVPAEGGEIRIEDLSLGDGDYDDVVLRVEMGPVVDEANLPNGTDPDDGALTVTGNLFTGAGGVKITTGADDPGTVEVQANEITADNTGGTYGALHSLVLDGDGDSITVQSEAGTLTINDDGSWSYTLENNTLAHPDNDPGGADHTDGDSDRGTGDQVQDIFSLNFTDADDDSVEGQLVININDDGPEPYDEVKGISGQVEEDDMLFADLDNSDGINEDGSSNADETSGGPGSIGTLFNIGADDENSGDITYGLHSDFTSLGSLTSHGENLQYKVVDTAGGQQLVGYTSYGTVFTLDVATDGSWDFDLQDQLDHEEDNNTEGWILKGSGAANGGIDFSSVVMATDADGDKAYGAADDSFVIQVQDDVPEAESTGISYFVSEYAGFDNLVGTYELDEFGNPVNAQIIIASTNDEIGGSKGENEHALGSYEAGTKFFIISDGGNNAKLSSSTNLKFVENTSGSGPAWVLAIDGTDTDIGSPVYFMDVDLNADGKEHFKDENGNLISEVPPEGGEIRIEDLSLGDADYDDVVLRVEMGPVVDEANLPDGTDPDDAALTVTGNLFTGDGGVKIITGADEFGSIEVQANEIHVDNHGAPIGSSKTLQLDGSGDSITVQSEAGILTINDDGTWSYTLQNNTLVHPDNDPGGADYTDGDSDRGTGDQVQDVFSLIYTDEDGDSVTPQLVININDDGPEANEDTEGIEVEVQEDDMLFVDGDLSDGYNEDSSTDADETSDAVGGNISVLFNVGADNENVTYGITNDFSSLGNLKSHGESLSYRVEATADGQQLIGSTSYGDVFTLTVDTDGTWDFDLTDQLDHEEDGNTEGWNLQGSTVDSGGIDFSSAVMVTDADGDKAYGAVDGSFVVKVQDDVPVAVQPEEVPQNLNLVLVLDNSGSMYTNSITWDGQPSTTRTWALRDSVKSLLDTLKNSNAANIQIHMVSFNTGAQVLGTFSLKSGGVVNEDALDDAEDALDSLESPYGNGIPDDEYTNYEAGFQQALAWTNGSEPLTGSDVVNQVLFVSDGDPNRFNDPDLGETDGPDPDPGNAATSLGEVLGTDGSNELELLAANGYSVRSVGINVSGGQEGRLDQVDSLGESVNISSGDELAAILPSLVSVYQPIISVRVEEDDLGNEFDLVDDDTTVGYNDDSSVNADEAEDGGSLPNLSALFISGADEELTYSISDMTGDLPVLWSGGEKLVYAVDGNVLTATAHGDTIFTFTVEADGSWKFDLDGQLDHVAGEGENLELRAGDDGSSTASGIDLSSVIIATDADHDQVPAATGAFVVEVEDDVPVIGDPYDAILANEDGNSLVADLNMDFGADGQGTIVITPDGDNVGKYGKVLDDDGDVMKLNGHKLYWHDNGDGSWSAQTYNGTVAFIVAPELDGASFTGNYTVDVINAIDDDMGRFYMTLEKPKGGGHEESTSIVLEDGNIRITATAVDPDADPDYVNWSVQGMGVGNEFIDYDNVGDKNDPDFQSEQLVLKFTDTSDEPLTVTTAWFGIDHLDKEHGQQEGEVGRWTAYKDGEEVGSDDFDGKYLGSSTDQFIKIEVDGGFDTVVFTADSLNADYRVTSVKAEYVEDSEHTFNFDVTVTDFDGDETTSTFDVTLDSDGVLTGGDEAEVFAGSTGDDTIYAGGGDDIVYAGDGDDTVYGNKGDDTIFGEEGDDTLRGNAGDDTIYGGEGDDKVIGGGGDDTLDGGTEADAPVEGNDKVKGGTGEDTFDSAEEAAGEVVDYSGDPAPSGVDQDDLDNLVPPPEV